MIIRDVIASAYVLLNNAGEDELDYAVAMEQLASIITLMKNERILGNVDEVITKGSLTFDDTTGITTNTLTNFGDVIYLEFNNVPIDEAPVSQLDLYGDAGVQRAAFYIDDTVLGTKKAAISLKQIGTLTVWYEPETSTLLTKTSTVELQDSLRWCLATRLAANLVQYIHFRDPIKMAGLPVLALTLNKQAEDWKNVYLEKMNKIGTGRPWTRLPFMAGVPAD